MNRKKLDPNKTFQQFCNNFDLLLNVALNITCNELVDAKYPLEKEELYKRIGKKLSGESNLQLFLNETYEMMANHAEVIDTNFELCEQVGKQQIQIDFLTKELIKSGVFVA